MKNRRYYIFGGSNEEGPRGWNDFIGLKVGAQAAMDFVSTAMLRDGLDWLHVVDAEELEIVYRVVRFAQGDWIIVPHNTRFDTEI